MPVERRQRAVTQRKTCKRYFAKFITHAQVISSSYIVRKTHVRHVHYMQSDEWRITISISPGNRCENFTEHGMDVPRNKGNYVPRKLLARKTGRRKFRDPFWYSATEFIMAARRSHGRFPVPQAKFETLFAISASLLRKNIREASFAFRCYVSTGNPYLCGIENPILRCVAEMFRDHVQYSFSEYYILVCLRFSLGLVWPGRYFILRSKF